MDTYNIPLPPMRLLGFQERRDVHCAAVSPRRQLPESPLAQALRKEGTSMPKLRIRTRLGPASGSESSPVVGTHPYTETPTPSLSGSLPIPIPVPELCRVSHSLEAQIMEDLSLDAAAQCVRGGSHRSTRAQMNCSVGAAACPTFFDEEASRPMEHDIETLAVAQLRGLEEASKQGEEELPIVHVVESMRYAAEDHDRMLLECAMLKARSTCDECVFDLDLEEPCRSDRAAFSVPHWVAA